MSKPLEQPRRINQRREKVAIYNYVLAKWNVDLANIIWKQLDQRKTPITFCRFKMLYGCYPERDLFFLNL